MGDFFLLPRLLVIEQLNLPIVYTDTQRVNKIGNLMMKLKRQGVIKTDEKRLWHLSENLSEILDELRRKLRRKKEVERML